MAPATAPARQSRPAPAVAPSRVAVEVAAGDCVRLTIFARERGVDPSTIWRWAVKGLPVGGGRRLKLEYIRAGKTQVTSRAAIVRFLSRLSRNSPPADATDDDASAVDRDTRNPRDAPRSDTPSSTPSAVPAGPRSPARRQRDASAAIDRLRKLGV